MRFKLVENINNFTMINGKFFIFENLLHPSILSEAYKDRVNLENKVGKELSDKFFALRKRLAPPENDLSHWLKKEYSADDLRAVLTRLENTKTRKQKDQEIEKGTQLIYKDKDWKVIKVNTYAASAKFGAMTRWCISGTRSYKSGLSGKDYFNQYLNQGCKIYFYLSRKYGKYALVDPGYGYCQIFSALDETVAEIPNAPSIPELDRLEPITVTRVYENEDWAVDQPDNTALHNMFICASKEDEENAYRYNLGYNNFMTATGDMISIDEFLNRTGESGEKLFNDFLSLQ